MVKDNSFKRKDIFVETFKKIKRFLGEQTEPIYKSEIVKTLKIDFNSVTIALKDIKHKVDEKGRIKI